MSQVLDIDECACSCHDSGAIHCVPCCFKCSVCRRRIELHSKSSHIEKCRQRYKEILGRLGLNDSEAERIADSDFPVG